MDKPWTAKLPHSLSTTCPQLHKQGLIHPAHILGGGDGMSPTFHHGYREIFGFLYPHNYFTLAEKDCLGCILAIINVLSPFGGEIYEH